MLNFLLHRCSFGPVFKGLVISIIYCNMEKFMAWTSVYYWHLYGASLRDFLSCIDIRRMLLIQHFADLAMDGLPSQLVQIVWIAPIIFAYFFYPYGIVRRICSYSPDLYQGFLLLLWMCILMKLLYAQQELRLKWKINHNINTSWIHALNFQFFIHDGPINIGIFTGMVHCVKQISLPEFILWVCLLSSLSWLPRTTLFARVVFYFFFHSFSQI